MKTYAKELAFARALAKEAGEIIKKYFATTSRTIKSNNTPITEADLAISKLVNDSIAKEFPNHAVMDEEKNSEYNHSHEYVWICDPVDGTIPFSHHIPTSVFSLALVKDSVPVLGVAYDPYLNRMHHAVKGRGAFNNGNSIKVGSQALVRGETLFTIPYWFGEERIGNKLFDYNILFRTCQKKGIIVSSVESIVYLSMLLADGSIAAMVTPAAYPWDRTDR